MPLDNLIYFYTQQITGLFGTVDSLHPGGHHGVDFAQNSGTPIPALLTGTVVDKSSDPNNSSGLGYYVVTQQSDGSKLWYGHMNAPAAVSVGQNIAAGQTLGFVGSTGESTGPHLHIGLQLGGGFVDPLPLIKSVLASAGAGQAQTSASGAYAGFAVGATPMQAATGSDNNGLGPLGVPATTDNGILGIPGAIRDAIAPLQSAVNGIGPGLSAIGSAAGDIAKLFLWFTTAKHWWAIGFVIVGVVVSGVGLVIFLSNTEAGQTVGKIGALVA